MDLPLHPRLASCRTLKLTFSPITLPSVDTSDMPRAGKRLIVACDGTWVSSDNGFVKDSWMPWSTSGRLATPSNVTKICRALLPRSTDGKDAPQVVVGDSAVRSAYIG